MDSVPLTFIPEDSAYVFNCPHCSNTIVVHSQEVNCQIFRHAVFKDTGLQVNPHASKAELDSLLAQELIHGCGKPFRFVNNGTEAENNHLYWTHAEICDYI